LQILGTEGGTANDTEGSVEFVATYKLNKLKLDHRERATFKKERRQVVLHRRRRAEGPAVKRTEPRVGRNDPCPCGSGKKYKKCHGVDALSAPGV